MKVLAVCASPRKNGNCDLLCSQLLKGAREGGNETDSVFLEDLALRPCRACYACRESGRCIQKDRGSEVMRKLAEADVIVLASPVYFYSVSAQMKTLIDRTLCCYTKLEGKRFVFILTGAGTKAELQRASESLYGFSDCLPGSLVMKLIIADGVYLKGDVRDTKAYYEAYMTGKNL